MKKKRASSAFYVCAVIAMLCVLITGCMPQGRAFPEIPEIHVVQLGNDLHWISKLPYQAAEISFRYETQNPAAVISLHLVGFVRSQGNRHTIVLAGKPDLIAAGSALFSLTGAQRAQISDIEITLLEALPAGDSARTVAPKLLGDFNNDGVVNAADVQLFAPQYGLTEEDDDDYDLAFDIGPAVKGTGIWSSIWVTAQPDGKIDLEDFAVLAQNFGKQRPDLNPSAPTPIAPEDKAKNVALNPTLRWSASVDPQELAVTYDIYLDTSVDPKTPIATEVAQTHVIPAVPLEAGTTYTWKVVAISAAGSSSSEVFQFHTIPVKPEAPVLLSPEADEKDVALDTLFEWEAVQNAAHYDLLLGTAATPTTVVRSGVTETAISLDDILANATTYYWRVVAYSNGSEGSESEIRSFRTISSEDQLPGSFSLLSPPDNAQGVPLPVRLTWKISERADEYDLYFGTDPDDLAIYKTIAQPASPTMARIEEPSTPTISEEPTGVTHETTYYWRVVARNAYGETLPETTGDEPVSFKTGEAGAGIPLRLLGNHGPFGNEENVYRITEYRILGSWIVAIHIGRLPDDFKGAAGWTLTLKQQEFTFTKNPLDENLYEVSIPDSLAGSMPEIQDALFNTDDTGRTRLRDLGNEGNLANENNVYQIEDTLTESWSITFRKSRLPQALSDAEGWTLTILGEVYPFEQNPFNAQGDLYELFIQKEDVENTELIRNGWFDPISDD